MISAVIFDLDGTLLETEELKALSYARGAAELRPDGIYDGFLDRRAPGLM